MSVRFGSFCPPIRKSANQRPFEEQLLTYLKTNHTHLHPEWNLTATRADMPAVVAMAALAALYVSLLSRAGDKALLMNRSIERSQSVETRRMAGAVVSRQGDLDMDRAWVVLKGGKADGAYRASRT